MVISTIINRLKSDTSGATAIEYALVAGLLSITIIAGTTNIGTSTSELFGFIDTEVTTATGQ